jgi:hypothetical protein
MKIPPVSNNAGQPVQPDKPDPKKVDGPRHAIEKVQAPESEPTAGVKVQISAEARIVRQRQVEITQLQVARKTADRILEQQKYAEDVVQRIELAESDVERARAEREWESARDSLVEAANRRQPEGQSEEIVLDGREVKFEVENKEYKLRTPDARKHVEKFVKAVEKSDRAERVARAREYRDESREFKVKTDDIQQRLERDIRKSIEGVVKESSNSRLSDAAEAEARLKDAMNQRADATHQRTPGMEGKAIDLLK